MPMWLCNSETTVMLKLSRSGYFLCSIGSKSDDSDRPTGLQPCDQNCGDPALGFFFFAKKFP